MATASSIEKLNYNGMAIPYRGTFVNDSTDKVVALPLDGIFDSVEFANFSIALPDQADLQFPVMVSPGDDYTLSNGDLPVVFTTHSTADIPTGLSVQFEIHGSLGIE